MKPATSEKQIRPTTVRLVGRLLAPLTDSGLFTGDEYSLILTTLRSLAKHGENRPAIAPKLISGKEAADMLGIAFSQFRALEKEGAFPFRRRVLGGKTVRFVNTEIVNFIMTQPENETVK